MVGLPSQLGKQIVDDICDKPRKLQGCCCAKAAHALWTLQLPNNINAHISNMDFTYLTYQAVFDAADKVYLSSKPSVSMAALSARNPTPPGNSIAADESHPLNTGFHQVAAVAPKKNKKPKNNKNKNQDQADQGQVQQQTPRKGPRHSSNPPHTCCDNHFRFGAGAWFCQAPQRCPWKDKVTNKP